MIKNIKLKFGRAPNLENEVIKTTPITVFVGPNNSGKSKILSEINRFCTTGQVNANDVIVEKIELDTIDQSRVDEIISKVTLKPNVNESILPDHIFVGKGVTRHQLQKQQIVSAFNNPNANAQQFCQWYLAYNTIILDGKSRINLVNQQNAGDLQKHPQTSFQVLFRDDGKREEVRRIIQDAFGNYFVLDPTNLGKLRLRLSSVAPSSGMEERGIHQESVSFHSNALLIEHASDGVKAFTGMVTEMVAGDPVVLLVDEPEAFLHPSLSFKLGKELSNLTIGSEKRLFVSTHSPNFVMGCIQSGAPVNIVRLTYRNQAATARILPNKDILKLMRNPLLRSTGVLSGLFYEFVIVTESDADRAFYQEINERMLNHSKRGGIPNCLFINAQNKQTVKTIIKPLRELGIPVAGIVDIDVIKDGGVVWKRFLECGFIPEIERNSLATLRASLKQKFVDSGKNMKKDGGIEVLKADDKEAANNLLERLGEYGLFVVPVGELESWLSGLKADGHGPNWLINIFEKMGEDPDSPQYIKPECSDVWGFLENISVWFTNTSRKGIPA